MKQKPEPMTKLLGVRVSKDIKTALDKEAALDSRTTASLIRKILKDYVVKKASK